MKIDKLDGIGLKRGVIAGARRVIMMQDRLNSINVFPVPDNDTGTNMALTMQSIAEGAINCHETSVSDMSQCLADSALMGARGNSGAILAQFFHGLSERLRGHKEANLAQFGEAVMQARDASYEALTEPQEGTILTVIHDWSVKTRSYCQHAHDFFDLLKEGLHEAQRSLRETPKKLKLLAKAGVVDAGAQGFVHMLEGVHHFMQSGKIDRFVSMGGGNGSVAKVERAPEDIQFQFCTECLVSGKNIDRQTLRSRLSEMGNSLIVAGSNEKVKIHIHTNEPQAVFDLIGKYGEITGRKFDDMRKQHDEAYSDKAVAHIALLTDTSCDLPNEYIIRHNIQMVPIQLAFGRDTYVDKITITPKEFYHLQKNSRHTPKTSQPTPGDFRKAYKEVLGHYDQVLSINLSGGLSGTLQAALTAARSVSDQKITVLNSSNTSVALGLIVSEAAKAIEDNKSFEEVVARARWAIENVRFFVYFDTVEYLIKGGRLSRSRGWLANALHLRPVLTVNAEGNAETVAKVGQGEPGLSKIMELLSTAAEGKQNLRFAVAHANAPEKAKWLEQEIRKQFEVTEFFVTNVSPALGAHAGPGAAGVAILGE